MRILFIFLLFLSANAVAQENAGIKSPKVEPSPLFQFIENKKQWNSEVLFRADVPAGFLFLKNNGLHYGFYDVEAVRELRHPRKKVNDEQANSSARTEDSKQDKYNIKAHGVAVNFLNANKQPLVSGQNQTEAIRNYFIAQDAEKWASEVHSFKEVNYLALYQAIDLRFFTQKDRLKYEFVVAAGGNPAQIQLKYEGADKIQIAENGDLEIETSVHTFGEKKPYCYQIINGIKVEIPSKFVLKDNIVSFNLQQYDKNLPLVIDPQLVFSTFSGSTADNWGNSATYDSLGNLYTAGTVFGTNFPITTGAFQPFLGGLIDIGISKYNPTGTRQLYTTFLGGVSAEVPHSTVVNHLNQLVVMGTTSSTNFPTTFGAFDRTYNGGNGRNLDAISGIPYNNGSDIFVSTISESGNSLLASTYLGGQDNDGINFFGSQFVYNYGDELRGEVVVDSRNNVYIASTTRSANFPLQSPAQNGLSGIQDAVFVKMNPQLSALQWSTYWGGNFLDVGYSIKLNKKNEIYVCGSTTSPNMRTSPDALHTAYQGSTDGYIARFTNNGGFLNASFLGTSFYDQAFLIDLDTADNVYVLGNSEGQYPVSQGVYSNANSGQFIQKINPALSTSIWSTVVGAKRGRPDISLTAFLVNECGNIYVAGWGGNLQAGYPANSTTNGMPVTADAIRTTTDGLDFHLMLLEKDAKSLLYGTFFGGVGGDGDHVDGGTCRFDKKGVVYHAACVCRSNRFFSTAGVWSNVNNAAPNFTEVGGCNNAAFKIDIGNLRAAFRPLENPTNIETRRGCAPLRIRFQNQSINGQDYEWDIAGLQTTQAVEPVYTFTQTGKYLIRLKVSSKVTCTTAFAYDTITVLPNITPRISRDSIICRGESLQLSASGGLTYRWSPATALSSTTIANPIANPTQTTRYTVTITNKEGCSRDTSTLVRVASATTVSFAFTYEDFCDPFPTIKLVNTSPEPANFTWNLGNGQVFNGQEPPPFKYGQEGNYRVSLVGKAGDCTNQVSQNIPIEKVIFPNVITPNGDGKNETLTLNTPIKKLNNAPLKLEIFNRWGKLVYQSENYQNDWKGEGIAAMYYYLVTSPDGNTCKVWINVFTGN